LGGRKAEAGARRPYNRERKRRNSVISLMGPSVARARLQKLERGDKGYARKSFK